MLKTKLTEVNVWVVFSETRSITDYIDGLCSGIPLRVESSDLS